MLSHFWIIWQRNSKKIDIFLIVLFFLTVIVFSSFIYNLDKGQWCLEHWIQPLFNGSPLESFGDFLVIWHNFRLPLYLEYLKTFGYIVYSVMLSIISLVIWNNPYWLVVWFVWRVFLVTIRQGILFVLILTHDGSWYRQIFIIIWWWRVIYVWLFVKLETKYRLLHRYTAAICSYYFACWCFSGVFVVHSGWIVTILFFITCLFFYGETLHWFNERLNERRP